MGLFSRFERRVEDGFDNINDRLFDSPISPVQIAKKAEKQMRREKMVGAGKEYAPTLYTVLVNPNDDERLFGYYPTLAGETETYLKAKAQEEGLVMDGAPLVRFIVDDDLKSGHFDIIAEMVSAPIVAQLRAEEMQRYGLGGQGGYGQEPYSPNPYRNAGAQPHQPYDAGQANGWDGGYDDGYDQGYGNGYDAAYDGYDQGFDANQGYGYVDENGFQQQPPVAGTPGAPQGVDDASGLDVLADEPSVEPTANPAAPIPNTAYFDDGLDAPQVSPDRDAAQPRLVNLATGRSFVLAHPDVLVGRGLNCDIVLDDLNASRTHAELVNVSPATWEVSDLGSLNGTLVNGRHVAQVVLGEGDRVTIGSTTFLFTFNDSGD